MPCARASGATGAKIAASEADAEVAAEASNAATAETSDEKSSTSSWLRLARLTAKAANAHDNTSEAKKLQLVVAAVLRVTGGRATVTEVLEQVAQVGLGGVTRRQLVACDFDVKGKDVALSSALIQEAVASYIRKMGAGAKMGSFMNSRLGLFKVVTKAFLKEHFNLQKGGLVTMREERSEVASGPPAAEERMARLKRAALKQATGKGASRQAEATSLLQAGPGDAYSQPPEPGERHGDPVFRHPYVQCLLRAAQEKVHEVLQEQTGPVEDAWLICVRTYARSGNVAGWPKREGIKRRGLLQMTLRALEQALGPAEAHKRCLIFVSHEDEDFTSGRLDAVLEGTPWQRRIIVGVKGADFQVRFIEEAFPSGAHCVVADDNIEQFVVEFSPNLSDGSCRTLDCESDASYVELPEAACGSELHNLITCAGREMKVCHANTWGLSASFNNYFMHNFGQVLQRRAKKTGVYSDYTKRLGLIYGAFFGIRVRHEAARYTRYGQVKDDVERTLRYWHLDGIILRFGRYAAQKAQKPGKFNAMKGGISAGSSAEGHAAEIERACSSMLKEFASPYARLPLARDGRQGKGHCGLVFHSLAPRLSAEELSAQRAAKLAAKRPRGRPRKDADGAGAGPASSAAKGALKRRLPPEDARPAKVAKVGGPATAKAAKVKSAQRPAKRPQGRPQKDADGVGAGPASSAAKGALKRRLPPEDTRPAKVAKVGGA